MRPCDLVLYVSIMKSDRCLPIAGNGSAQGPFSVKLSLNFDKLSGDLFFELLYKIIYSYGKVPLCAQ